MDVGVDVGTTVTKAVAFDEAGRQLAETSRPTRLVRPGPGRFEHDTDEAARVRVRLLRELASTGEALVATHLPFPSVSHVAAAGSAFRWVPACWEY